MEATRQEKVETPARLLVDEFRERFSPLITEGMADLLLAQIDVLLTAATSSERRQCEDLCIERAALWNGYITRHDAGALRGEAEMREKEALYLADAIAARDPAR